MDTSKTYIKMCGEAGEIQKQWKPIDGDCCWHDDSGDDYLGSWEFPATTAVVHMATGNDKNYWYNWLWLPHQDQLQEMLNYKEKTSYPVSHMIKHIDEFYSTMRYWEQDAGDITMEQLWLAFVMKEKYNKTWGGNEWGYE